MQVGDVVVCRNNKKAVIVNVSEDFATVIFLKPGMYMPENFLLKDLAQVNESKTSDKAKHEVNYD